MKPNRFKRDRKGAVAVLAVVFLIIIFGMVAFAVDLGYVMVAKADLQRAADSAAHAAVLDLRAEGHPTTAITNARLTAKQYVEDNYIIHSSATVDANFNNFNPSGDVIVGRIDFDTPRSAMTHEDQSEFNAVRVRIRKSADSNGELNLFFAKMLGFGSMAIEAEATAAVIKNVGGFKISSSGANVPFLPITVHEAYWTNGINENSDNWSYNPANGSVSAGGDGVPEIILFPSNPDSAGNFGTVNIGTSSESTRHLAGQIRYGLSPSDLAYHGGEIALNESGELELSGNPGLSASIKDDLQSIMGKPVVIPIYRNVSGNGSKAKFDIVKFAGVRVVAVKLTGKQKYVSVQPANVTFKGVTQAPTRSSVSENIYSSPLLVQ